MASEVILDVIAGIYLGIAFLTADSPSGKEKPLPKESDHIAFHFGEFRLICIDYLQTTLLLLRGTAWQLEPIIKFSREKQLPYFTRMPNSLLKKVTDEIVNDLKNLVVEGPDRKDLNIVSSSAIEPLVSSINNVLAAKKCQDLLDALKKVTNEARNIWVTILTSAEKSLETKKTSLNSAEESLKNTEERVEKESPKNVEVIKKDLERFKKDLEERKKVLEVFQKDLDSIRSASRLVEGSRSSFSFALTIQEKPDKAVFRWERQAGKEKHLLEALRKFARESRENAQPHSPTDRLAFHAGYYLLSQGQNKIDPYQSRTLGTVGFREDKWQTYLSLTDPGQGHVFGTTTRAQWMKGAIIHVEHLERPANTTQAQIESYRIPSVLEFARVCLHTGYTSPNTCYVGRPLRDSGDFKYDFIKVVDTVAAACSSMFSLGAAECKIAVSGVKSSEAIAYMRALSGHTRKNYRQYFSAAFNLNTPLVDDLKGEYLSKPMNIGKRAIELAALGGFDKVTWDGAADFYPSTPMLKLSNSRDDHGLLSRRDATTLVHMAHSAGLTTYFSAGFKTAHIDVAVQSGVDGIGIGGAQVLRNMDNASKMHGEYKESRIDDLIDRRDKAADSLIGRAAHLLARLDQMYYEGCINDTELRIRSELYEILCEEDPNTNQIKNQFQAAEQVIALTEEQEYPWNKYPWRARVKRLTVHRQGEAPLLQRCAEYTKDEKGPWKSDQDGAEKWRNFEDTLKSMEDKGDEGDIHSFALSEEWKYLTGRYREHLRKVDANGTPEYFAGEINYNLKVSPFDGRGNLVVSDVFDPTADHR